ncbi:MAG: hypothetical protein J6B77_03190, partial [Clostridia bacterium]|nr:hypothetical protein [Clostridia bacterium]
MTLLEKLARYQPGEEHRAILSRITNYSMRIDKAARIIEVTADFPTIVPKQKLYAIENEIRTQYELNCVRILPHYPSELFSDAYIPEILTETERTGTVARGFFGIYEYHLDGETLTVELPLSMGSMDFLGDAKTANVITNIIRAEFGLSVKTELVRSETLVRESDSYTRALEELNRSVAEANRHYEEMQRNAESTYHRGGNGGGNESPADAPDAPDLKRVYSVYDEDATPDFSVDGQVRIGHTTFDISSPEYVLGEPFEVRPMNISAITHAQKNVIFVGDVICYTE